jgi:hypothetical protein
MAAPDIDIQRTAYLFVRFHGDAAAERARLIAERMHSKGDQEGADTWLRIRVAIGELGAPTT